MGQLRGQDLWTTIQAAAVNQPKMAAVAYVSSDRIVAFGAGDMLVTDASDEAIGAGQTRARVLEVALGKGARMYSCANLHAKVMVLGKTAFIGSCNLSSNSVNVLTEAAWVTDQPSEVAEAQSFIQSLVATSTPIDKAFITRILGIQVRPRPRGSVQQPTLTPADIVLLFFKQGNGPANHVGENVWNGSCGNGYRLLIAVDQ